MILFLQPVVIPFRNGMVAVGAGKMLFWPWNEVFQLGNGYITNLERKFPILEWASRPQRVRCDKG